MKGLKKLADGKLGGFLSVVAVIILAGISSFLLCRDKGGLRYDEGVTIVTTGGMMAPVPIENVTEKCKIVRFLVQSNADTSNLEIESQADSKAEKTEEEKREAEEEKLVNDFDDLTDKWMEPSAKGVKMEDIDNFTKSFRRIPKARRDECIHRALNLIPDENVMLLAGVLMDKSMDKEIVETVYNDILNRDEDVKKPILKEIFKDKSHPCWTDTAWILDVTGELPKSK